MEIRLVGSPEEIEAAVALIRQNFTIHQDGGNYQGRNPRYASQNQGNRIRKLIISPKPPAKTGREGGSYDVSTQPRTDDVVLGGQKTGGNGVYSAKVTEEHGWIQILVERSPDD